jgi:ribonuclease VapC
LATFNPEIIAFDDVQRIAAFAAFKFYGKGQNSDARLNFGDCASYALAKTRNVPLLFKSNDFAATDIVAAV